MAEFVERPRTVTAHRWDGTPDDAVSAWVVDDFIDPGASADQVHDECGRSYAEHGRIISSMEGICPGGYRVVGDDGVERPMTAAAFEARWKPA